MWAVDVDWHLAKCVELTSFLLSNGHVEGINSPDHEKYLHGNPVYGSFMFPF